MQIEKKNYCKMCFQFLYTQHFCNLNLCTVTYCAQIHKLITENSYLCQSSSKQISNIFDCIINLKIITVLIIISRSRHQMFRMQQSQWHKMRPKHSSTRTLSRMWKSQARSHIRFLPQSHSSNWILREWM